MPNTALISFPHAVFRPTVTERGVARLEWAVLPAPGALPPAVAPLTALVCLPRAVFRATVTERGVARLEREVLPAPAAEALPPLVAQLAQQLTEYFAGQRRSFSVPVDLSQCTDFQRRVLEACARIAAGEVVTYAELASRIGQPEARQAVGQALARNPVPILIPCHRVVGSDGDLVGFTAGVAWKRCLLSLEGVSLP